MRLDEIELREASFGSNPDGYDNGKIGYNSAKKALYLVQPLDDKFYLVCIQYFNGNCVFTTTESQQVDKILTGSVESMLRPANVAKALRSVDLVSDMFSEIIRKYHTRLPTIRFTTFDETNARKMKLALEKPVLKANLTRYNYSFVETTKDGKAILQVFSNENQ